MPAKLPRAQDEVRRGRGVLQRMHDRAFAALVGLGANHLYSPSPSAGKRGKIKGGSDEGASDMAEWFVAKASDLPEGDRRIVTAGNDEIGVFHHGGAYYAYSNYCVHSGGPACEGIMINKVVDLIDADRTYQGQTFSDEMHFVCPWHGYEYELTTGRCAGDHRLKLKKYNVVRRGDDIYVVA
jgi:nitrite reductase/ring-hydroxylating ferredoxin subunit